MTIEKGFCECGCGIRTGIAVQNDHKHGYVKGQPYRFANGHNRFTFIPEYIVDAATGCWNWQRYKISGYGRCQSGNGTLVMAHRLYYERYKGAIPEGLEVDHLCCNRACVNPSHLEAVTQTVNIQRCPATTLKPDEVRQIRYLYAAGIDPKDIAPDFNVSWSTVYRIIEGKSWTNI